MKITRKIASVLLSLVLLLMLFTACDAGSDADTDTSDTSGESNTSDTGTSDTDSADTKDSSIASVRRINGTDIEVTYLDAPKSDPRALKFTVKSNGEKQSYNMDYGYGGAVYFDGMLTLSLETALPEDAEVTLTYDGVTFDVPYEPYYQYEYISESGIPVRGSRAMLQGEETVKRAAEIIDLMLSESPEIAEQLVRSGAQLVIFGKGEHAYYIPEHRSGYDEAMLYVEGFGGTTCSVTESNIWHWVSGNTGPDSSYKTAYANESVLVHEFAHGIKLAGFDVMADQSLADEYQMVYRHAKASGLWRNSYAISNSDEFFATLSSIWFNVMIEAYANDGWDGVRGPINTREELYNYDPVSYNFFAKIYPYENLDGAWTPVPDTVTITGLGKEPAPDYDGAEYTFAYPGQSEASGVLDFSKTYKFSYSEADFIIDTAAVPGTGIGLWWDYLADYPDNAAMTYNIELVEGTEPEIKDGLTVYTVRIKGVRDGYLYQSGDYMLAGASAADAAEITLTVNGAGLATIGCDGRVLFVDGDPDNGTLVKLVEGEGSSFYIKDVSASSGGVVFAHNCEINGSAAGAILSEGEAATLTAAPTLDGKSFVRFECSAGTIADAASTETEFTMPAGDAVVWAIYE